MVVPPLREPDLIPYISIRISITFTISRALGLSVFLSALFKVTLFPTDHLSPGVNKESLSI